jgi:metal-responsive CopG/Arc/MetJ family transcriptional regulator
MTTAKKKRKRIVLNLTPRQIRDLERLAKLWRVSRAEAVRRILREEILGKKRRTR